MSTTTPVVPLPQGLSPDQASTLRLHSLSFFLSIASSPLKSIIHFYNRKDAVEGMLRGADPMQTQFQVDGLKTELGVYERVAVRAGDVRWMEVELPRFD
ncbi:hypothetical protein HDV05_006722 [Chytridiales sp. JEL 0842]|nr:hypothetical protein HDV05_006722 [Chytridiales sp. JEL 0842]